MTGPELAGRAPRWRHRIAQRIRKSLDLARTAAESELDVLKQPRALKNAREELDRPLRDEAVAFTMALRRAVVQIELICPILARDEGDPAFPSLQRATPADVAEALKTHFLAEGLDAATIRRVGLAMVCITEKPGGHPWPGKAAHAERSSPE